MALTKKTRFEVLKRDGYKCRYCGRKAPDVVLHVDHVLAVSNGGTDCPSNLVAACLECNLGKSARRLDAVIGPLNMAVAPLGESISELEEYRRKLLEKSKHESEKMELLIGYWCGMEGQDINYDYWVAPWGLEKSLGIFSKRLSGSDIMEAMTIAFRKIGGPGQSRRRMLYFFKICWSWIKEGKTECTSNCSTKS